MDAYARAIIPFVAPRLGNASMVVINRPNASGQLAFESVAAAEPDGYTIGVAQTPNLITLPIERQVRYRVQDLTYLANVVEDPGGIFVRADSPLQSMKDLVEAARERPERISIGSAGIGTDDHLLILALQEATRARFSHVPYAGTPPIIQGVLAQDIAAGSLNVSEGIALVRQGSLRLLGQGGPARWQEAAEVPTFREQGIDMVAGSVRGVIGPPGMQSALRDRFRTAFAEALSDPAWIREAARLSLPLRVMTGEEQRSLYLEDDARLRALWQRQPWRE
ncbi:tripartite tricarboxylate transporter substrate binding protein [Pseudoroseomonas globiformis]|uniref:Tripartite tricarboxylate transporter substrate binding protein n=1 Tax=Teichococcus globiformis TaxID=2307229 RepID=A0ABV7G0Z8_9PROT